MATVFKSHHYPRKHGTGAFGLVGTALAQHFHDALVHELLAQTCDPAEEGIDVFLIAIRKLEVRHTVLAVAYLLAGEAGVLVACFLVHKLALQVLPALVEGSLAKVELSVRCSYAALHLVVRGYENVLICNGAWIQVTAIEALDRLLRSRVNLALEQLACDILPE